MSGSCASAARLEVCGAVGGDRAGRGGARGVQVAARLGGAGHLRARWLCACTLRSSTSTASTTTGPSAPQATPRFSSII